MYRLPSSDLYEFLYQLETLLNDLHIKSKFILTGYLNTNFIDKGTITNSLINMFLTFNLNMHVKSRISQNSNRTIDYICSKLDTRVITCTVQKIKNIQ